MKREDKINRLSLIATIITLFLLFAAIDYKAVVFSLAVTASIVLVALAIYSLYKLWVIVIRWVDRQIPPR